jgi:hypothetical protein
MLPNRCTLARFAVLLGSLALAGCAREAAEPRATTPPAATATEAAVPTVAPAATGAPGAPAPSLAPVKSTAVALGHVTLTGSYKADAEAEATCAPADTALQITLVASGQPRVVLHLADLAAKGTSGTYKGQVDVIAPSAGEAAFQPSSGKVSVDVTVEPEGTAGAKAVSGAFSTSFAGEGGKGTVAGRFDRCIYKSEKDS